MNKREYIQVNKDWLEAKSTPKWSVVNCFTRYSR